MTLLTPTKHILEPITHEFLNKINTLGGKPIYELSPEEARNVLLKVQEVPVSKLPADIEDRTISTGPNENLQVRIFRPKGNKTKLPVIMYFHGGGWILGDENTHDRVLREITNGAQAAVVFVKFDRSPESQYPIAIEQAYAATKFISENSNSFNLNPSKLAVAGDSAGGNMAAIVALLAKNRGGPEISYQVLFYPVTDANFETDSYKEFANNYWLSKEAMKWFWDAYLPDDTKRKQYTASPLLASADQLKGLPPALVITAECDVLRDEGEAYADKLMKSGVKTTAVRFLGTIHDFLALNALADSQATRGALELASLKLRQALD